MHPCMQVTVEEQFKRAVDQIVNSRSRKKLIVAGPGTGKTKLFRKLLESTPGDQKSRLVLTFINNLKADLEQDLSDLAGVFTLHGYCQSLLRRRGDLRGGITTDFRCLPGMASLIKNDWRYLKGEPVPPFVERMRSLEGKEELDFYFERANYYDGVDFDDSVFRVYQRAREATKDPGAHDLVLIDEYQDFNRMEAGFIELLAKTSPIVIAGDDDQALYSQLRGSSWEFIRSLYQAGEYECFELPFCMRCPEVIVDAVNDIMLRARELRRLEGRIEKPYRYYAPLKGVDSKTYPKIGLVLSTVQRLNANYFGRYVEYAISKIPTCEIEEAAESGDPTVLIVGSKQYLQQIAAYLTGCGYAVDTKRDSQARLDRASGVEVLNEDSTSNLGWRVMLEFEKPDFAASKIREAADKRVRLVDVIPLELQAKILNEVKEWKQELQKQKGHLESTENQKSSGPVIKMTSFEGAKGLSAQHVFIVGMHEGELPRDTRNIQDIEICRFVVGLTRTRKKCSLLYTSRFADKLKRPSQFLSWIKSNRYEFTRIDAKYWEKTQK